MGEKKRTEVGAASTFVPLYGFAKGKFKARRHDNVEAIVIHTTGSGPVRNAGPAGDPFQTAVDMYRDGRVGHFGAHFVVGQRGECIQMVPMDFGAWHVGSSRRNAYVSPDWNASNKYGWWFQRWPDFKSPRELAEGQLWRTGRPNDVTVGIEVVCPRTISAPWSDRCWKTLVGLCEEISSSTGVRLSRERVITHSDAAPISRTTFKGAPWDPPPSKWKGWQSFARRAGLPEMCG